MGDTTNVEAAIMSISESRKACGPFPLLNQSGQTHTPHSPGMCVSPGLPDLSRVGSRHVRTCDGGRSPPPSLPHPRQGVRFTGVGWTLQ